MHLHQLDIIHRDLKPENIMVIVLIKLRLPLKKMKTKINIIKDKLNKAPKLNKGANIHAVKRDLKKLDLILIGKYRISR